MVIYNSLIDRIKEILPSDIKKLDYKKTAVVKGNKNDIIFARDSAYELGGSVLPCVSTLAVSSDKVFSDCSYLLGKDIYEIKQDVPFGKIVFLQIEDISDDDKAFDKIKELEFVRYSFIAKDFMPRVSALSMREQIRVGKNAVRNRISFADYGSALIDEYKKNPIVKSVEIYFLTDFNHFDELNALAEKVKNTTSALNHILDNVIFDCSSCNLKEICDEVDGMKDLHMKANGIK